MKTHRLLLTGATGALGRPLMDQLLADPAVECLYAFYRHGPDYPLPERVIPVFGDLRNGTALGLSAHQQTMLRKNVTAVLHGAADTRFDAPFAEAYATNVTGTRNLLQFVASCPRLDRFIHLSTLCCAGRRTGCLKEEPWKARHGFVNHYEATKNAAEFIVRGQSAVPAAIIRLSTVIGFEENGVIHQMGALHRALRLMYASLVPMMPARPHCPVDLISVEYAARVVTELACRQFMPESIRHVCAAREYLPLDVMLDLAFETFAQRRPAWRRRAIERPVTVDFETFDLFRRTVEETGAPGLIESLRLLSSFAPQLLYPKTYHDAECQRALAGAGIPRPNLRELFPRVVTSLITRPEMPGRIAMPHLEAA